jgi:hypothetical protein
MTPTNSAMRQFCSVCKSTFEMEVVRESAEDGVIWLRCPNCQGILPHMPDIAAPDAAAEVIGASEQRPSAAQKAEDALAAAADLLDEIDPEKARPYIEGETYEVGQVIHHRAWNDYGIVRATETLPGNRLIIRVRFVNAGEVQLLVGTDH